MPSNETKKSGKVFVPPSKICKKYHRTSLTLRRWAEQGRLDHIITPTGRNLYNIHQVEQILGQEGNEERKKICYARVSSAKQKEDLQRHVQDLRDKYLQHELIQEVGSGVNFQRKGFQKLVDQICEGMVSEVVILQKDRLCRFGYDLLEHICQRFHTKLLVHGKEKENEWQ
jgi:putative resolvase